MHSLIKYDIKIDGFEIKMQIFNIWIEIIMLCILKQFIDSTGFVFSKGK